MDHTRDRKQYVKSPVNWDLGRSVKDNAFHNQNIGLNPYPANVENRVSS